MICSVIIINNTAAVRRGFESGRKTVIVHGPAAAERRKVYTLYFGDA